MNYNLSEIDGESSKRAESPYLGYGSNQVLKINSIELIVSQNTGSPKAIFHMESKPVTTPGFTPVEGAKGKVGKVACGVYMKEDRAKKEFLEKLKRIADTLGLKDEVNEIKGESFEGVVDEVGKLIAGKYARYTILAEEYAKEGGKVGIKLTLPRFNFVDILDSDGSGLEQFDKNNPWHYKKIPDSPVDNKETFSDLPF